MRSFLPLVALALAACEAPNDDLVGEADAAVAPDSTPAPTTTGPESIDTPAGRIDVVSIDRVAVPGRALSAPVLYTVREVSVGDVLAVGLNVRDLGVVRGLPDDPAVVLLQTARATANAWSRRDELTECYAYEGSWLMPIRARCDGWRLPYLEEFEALVADAAVPMPGGHLDEASRCYTEATDRRICYACTCPHGPRPVGSSRPNVIGLQDMIGNVEEWVEKPGYTDDRRSPANGVIIGGSWESSVFEIADWRNAIRNTFGDDTELAGFHLVRFVP